MTLNLADQPEQAQLRIAPISDQHWRFRLVLAQPDVAAMVGRNGMTISALKSMIKVILAESNLKIQLNILSHEEAGPAQPPATS